MRLSSLRRLHLIASPGSNPENYLQQPKEFVISPTVSSSFPLETETNTYRQFSFKVTDRFGNLTRNNVTKPVFPKAN